MGKGSYPSINQTDVEELKIPLPPLEIQQQIVSVLQEERNSVQATEKLIAIFEKKIHEKISSIF